MDIIKKHLESYIKSIQDQGRKRFNLTDIEKCVVKRAGGNSRYTMNGGYCAFYDAVLQLQGENIIRPVQASQYNGMTPPLKTKWSIVDKPASSGWPTSFIMQVSDCLDMSGYVRNPGWQTEREKEYIQSIHNFLNQSDLREWASCEERCLELFGDEKFLSTDNKRVLSRINLSYEYLKMKKYGQMFSYWTSGKKAKTVMILENHSTFFSFKRCVEEGIQVFGFMPDLIIFGNGKRIVKSLEFLNEIADAKWCEIKYFGDIDPEGWLIYRSLREKYPELDISLFIPAYEYLLGTGKSYPIGDIMQSTNSRVLEYITKEFEKNGKEVLNTEVKQLWEKRRRIPQEFVTYEKMKLQELKWNRY